MPKQRKLFTLSDDAVEHLEWLSRYLGLPMSAVVENLISSAYRNKAYRMVGLELCTMVYDPDRSEVRFEDVAGGVLAVFHLSE